MDNQKINLQLLNDHAGKLSSMRLLVSFIVVVYMVTWAWLSIQDGAMYDIDWEQAAVIVGALFAKANQAQGEKDG